MELVTVKFEIPRALQPRIYALAKELGLPVDVMCVMLLQDGYTSHLRQALARAEAEVRRWREEDAQ